MSVLLRPRWLVLHLLVMAAVIACVLLALWQFERAEAGNGRSIGYALQWPGFGLFTVAVWAWLCRDGVRARSAGPRAEREVCAIGRIDDDLVLPPVRQSAHDPRDAADPELAAYNRMLARLGENGGRRPHTPKPEGSEL